MLGQEFGVELFGALEGIKIAQVVSNADPKCQERILIRVLGVHNLAVDTYDNGIWAHHCSPFRDSSGDLPEKYDFVYVMFPNKSDPMSCIWLGFVRSTYQEGVLGKTVIEKSPAEIQDELDKIKEAEAAKLEKEPVVVTGT